MADTVTEIERIKAVRMRVPIVGTTPLIVHRFSEKMKRQMLQNMQGKKTPKESKDPEAEFKAAAYRFEDGGYGFPAVGFKACTVGAGRYFDQVTMTMLRQCLFFHGEVGEDRQQLVRIEKPDDGPDEWPVMREDVVTVGRGGADLRYRPEFWPWQAVLDVTYVKAALTQDSVLSLIDAGGMGVGVGDWRPQKKGDFGQFEIDTDREVEVIKS